MIETILVFVLIPLAIYGVAGALTLRSKFGGAPRYRPGQPWTYPAQWWSANLADRDSATHDTQGQLGQPGHSLGSSTEVSAGTATLAAGGARGNW